MSWKKVNNDLFQEDVTETHSKVYSLAELEKSKEVHETRLKEINRRITEIKKIRGNN